MDIINHLIARFGYKKYLEIGLNNPDDCFNHIMIEEKDSVDPGVVVGMQNNRAKYKVTSDEFFDILERGHIDRPSDFKWDIIFIDGLHLAPQVEKDIENALRHLSDNGTIVLHDCNPPEEHYARCDCEERRTPAGGFWNGTVWKSFYKLRCVNEQVDACVVDRDWGCGIVRKGSQELCEFDNPYYEFDVFAKNRTRHLNLIDPSELDAWIDSPFYKK